MDYKVIYEDGREGKIKRIPRARRKKYNIEFGHNDDTALWIVSIVEDEIGHDETDFRIFLIDEDGTSEWEAGIFHEPLPYASQISFKKRRNKKCQPKK